ncbi:hypothetical protein EGW08_007315 [Elysia chlorotica]|uniref:Uncharacterized protein n=1 Tax=Elysia chlorotica TaxID=188477 RepID=A0A433TTL3_ELYCH|nr:hypothetical protein EGW08_007315 [Elysia chlorotica]
MSSGRPLGYTRDRLQGVLQRLRQGHGQGHPHPQPSRSRSEDRSQGQRSTQDQQPRSRSEGGPHVSRAGYPHYPPYLQDSRYPQYLDRSAQSDPFPHSRYDTHDNYSREHASFPQIAHDDRSYADFAAFDPRGRHYGDEQRSEVMADGVLVPSPEKNEYVNLQNFDRERRNLMSSEGGGLKSERGYNYPTDEDNPYKNLPQPGLPSSYVNPDLRHFPHHGAEEQSGARPRALSEGSRMFSARQMDYGEQVEDGGINRGASYPDVSLPRPVRDSTREPDLNGSNQHFRPWYPSSQDGIGTRHQQQHQHQHQQYHQQQQYSNPSSSLQPSLRHPSSLVEPGWGYPDIDQGQVQGQRIPSQYSGYPGYSETHQAHAQPRLGYQSSSSSGIGSRNTSQSTGSLQPHSSHPSLPLPPHSSQSHFGGEASGNGSNARYGTRGRGAPAGRGATSCSSGPTDETGDLSLDTSSVIGHSTPGVRGDPSSQSLSVPHPRGLLRHRRDTSVDENYEFDSINALENDIMDDLRRYSRLAGGVKVNGSGSRGGVTQTKPGSRVLTHGPRDPSTPHQQPLSISVARAEDPSSNHPAHLPSQKFPVHPIHGHHKQPTQPQQEPLVTLNPDPTDNPEHRFERLREEFKAYRSQRNHGNPYAGTGSEDGSVDGLMHPPTAGSALPIGLDGEPLYPMDSEML